MIKLNNGLGFVVLMLLLTLERMRVAWIALLFSSFVMAQADGRVDALRFGLDRLGDLVEVRSPRVSPNAKSIVVVVLRPDYEENIYASQLVLVEIGFGHTARVDR